MAGQPPLNPGWRLTAAIYPFAAGAAAVNLYFVFLILSWIGLAVPGPAYAVVGGLILGLPAAGIFARHIRRLIAEAERR
ncbi:NnrT protein [Amaricoccus sp. W119]|uniref:NnrT protein n=1 Tax=Amaricoccus sp. W119 TaxID=3391833 RepID=UPI0039A3FEE4